MKILIVLVSMAFFAASCWFYHKAGRNHSVACRLTNEGDTDLSVLLFKMAKEDRFLAWFTLFLGFGGIAMAAL